MSIPRSEYPRPQFVREDWINLNGEWNFAFDDNDEGIKANWFQNPELKEKITVPYVFQSKLSGINKREFHDIVWYSKSFTLPKEMCGKRILLNFGAVDYKADVWVNGTHICTHEGGHISFSAEITNALTKDTNLIVLRAQDYSKDLTLPRGKQYWKPYSESIFYTGTTGIWQTVWLEAVSDTYIESIKITPNIDEQNVFLEFNINGTVKGTTIEAIVISANKEVAKISTALYSQKTSITICLKDLFSRYDENHLFEGLYWSPEHPTLFDLKLALNTSDKEIDSVSSYFGLRKVSIQKGKFMLNNRPYYQKMLLDQGYWEDSLLTAPDDKDFIKDIELSKQMGFNGVRKHQKIEDPRYLYWADKMGFLVWGETANAYAYSREYVSRITTEWIEMIHRDYNHPCIVAWTPINESWGVPNVLNNKEEQAHATALYWITKSLDQTRPVISNDGWEHTKSDLFTIHDYEHKKEVLTARYATLENILKTIHSSRAMFAQGWEYEDQPIIMSEFGGISYKKSDWSGWGYSNATSDEDFASRYNAVVSAMLESPLIQGFVYTQITDVEQEINGLLTYRREPKIDLEIIKKINEGKWQPK